MNKIEQYLADQYNLYNIDYTFEISLQGEKCNEFPLVKIIIDDVTYYNGEVSSDFKIKIEKTFVSNQPGYLKIEHYNKQPEDTLVVNNEIVADKKFTIQDIVINDVSLRSNQLLHLGKYYPTYPNNFPFEKIEIIDGADVIGLNGSWILAWDNQPLIDFVRKTKIGTSQHCKNIEERFLEKTKILLEVLGKKLI